MITVWGRRNSVNVQKVMWAVGELEVEYKRHDMAGSFGVTEEYLLLNQKGTVPTIQDGDLTLWESNACVRYLAKTYGTGSLYPADPATAAIADQWMAVQTSTLTPPFFQIFFNKIRLPAEKSRVDQIEMGITACTALFKDLDDHLAGKNYITGDDFTMGDICVGTLLYRYFSMDIERPDIPNVQTWYARLQGRPAYRQHVMIPFGSNADEWLEEEKKNARIQ